jgi:hypothetical protein
MLLCVNGPPTYFVFAKCADFAIFARFWPQKRATLLFSAVRFDGGRAGGPCSFGGYKYACDLLC